MLAYTDVFPTVYKPRVKEAYNHRCDNVGANQIEHIHGLICIIVTRIILAVGICVTFGGSC